MMEQSAWVTAIEKLSELIDTGEPANQALEQGLATVLAAFNRASGAILLLHSPLTDSAWHSHNASPEWFLLCAQPASDVSQAVQSAVQAGRYVPVPASVSGLAGIFPLTLKAKTFGVVLVGGEPMSAEEQTYWNVLLKLLAQVVYAQVIEHERDFSKELAAINIIANSQKTISDINELQLEVARNIKKLFEAEEAQLILLDEENPELVVRKRLLNGGEWTNQVSQRLEDGLIQACIRERSIIQRADVARDPKFNPYFDSALGVELKTFLCLSLGTADTLLGALVLLNPQANVDSPYHRVLLESLSTALANSIHNSRLFLQLKISNADLEASRLELLNSRNTLRTLFDSIPLSIYIVDKFYNLVAINLSRARRAGEKPAALVGWKCYEKLVKRTSPCPGCRVMETLQNGKVTDRIGREWVDSDKFIEWEIGTFPISDRSGRINQAILTEQDVTEKRNLEANLIQSEKLAGVGQLAAGVAHEINNPLAAIIANAQILMRCLPSNDKDLLESVKLIETAGLRASQVVRNLLGIARKDRYEFLPTDINETLRNSLSLVQHEVVKRPIEIHLDLSDDLPLIKASKDHLQSVWINFILNAMDAIEERAGVITITTRANDSEVQVSVSDTGKGISEDKLARIFEPFYTTKLPGRGTGLGLSVCMRIIKQHSGTIHVDSQPGRGTRFTVALPLGDVLIDEPLDALD
jgi:two-component system NtrC family sensor kinase